MSAPRAVVIGGGMVGLAVARELVSRQYRVRVIERARCGSEASSAAAGLLEPFAEPDQPAELVEACLASLALWPGWLRRIEEETGRSLELADWGTLFVALDPEQAAFRDRIVEEVHRYGGEIHPLDRHQAWRRVPQLSEQILPEVLHLPAARRIDNPEVCAALAEACRVAGVDVVEESAVERVELAGERARIWSARWQGECHQVVLAAGAWSGSIDGLPTLPVRPRRGQLVAWDGCRWAWSGCIRCGRRYVLRRRRDLVIAGSTVEDVGFERGTTEDAVAEIRRFATALLPVLSQREPTAAWSGLRPGTPDGLPILGRWQESPLWIATGHFRNGVLLAPWTAGRIAAWMAGDAAPPEPGPFDPGRLAS